MHYIRQHIADIISTYTGNIPLAYFLKTYFKKYPKLGSRDRKILSSMAYSFYRCSRGLILKDTNLNIQVAVATFLCETDKPYIKKILPEAWHEIYGYGFEDRLSFLEKEDIRFEPEQLFPGNVSFSQGMARKEWLQSMLQQPRLFIHVAHKHISTVRSRLTEAGIAFEQITDQCFALANGSAIDKTLDPGSYRVQDASSQSTGTFFQPVKGERWWDCCCGAGGKSLLLNDYGVPVNLTVSDIRPSILHNLSERFKLYQYKVPETIQLSVADKTGTRAILGERLFDHIICDVPCSGSGTWARTPEQLYFFNPATVDTYAQTQLQIVSNAIHYLEPGGTLFYITCSVFRAENEGVLDKLLSGKKDISLQKSELINGLDMQADSMFIAMLQKD